METTGSSYGTAHAYALGIDLGSQSVGWHLLLIRDDVPVSVAACGVHTFDAGVEGDIESGKDTSRGIARRQARQIRRQFWRRQRRRLKVMKLLRGAGLLPEGDVSTPEAIHAYFLKLDAELAAAWEASAATDADRVMLPYRLRAAALDRKLSPTELGRALYHLAQRRGFKSNRKSQPKEGEDTGIVKKNIGDLYAAMEAARARTLGEFFARTDPRAAAVRRRHTHRDMFIHEFRQIWEAQAPHHTALTPALRKELFHALFFQRPLKSQAGLIGTCELVPHCKRAPLASLLAQRFRLLQKVNDLLVEPVTARERPLTPKERAAVLQLLETEGDQKFTTLRKKLKLPAGTRFNLERGGEEKLPGNRTAARLRKVFGDRWDTLPGRERSMVIEDLLTIESPETMAHRGRRFWQLDDDHAELLADTVLEQDYASHCREALEKLIVPMEQGTPYMTARKELYPDSFRATLVLPKLPPARDVISNLRNPAVERALAELRKVVNAVIARYGRPDVIRVELARDLRNPRKRREEMSKRMRDRQKEREGAMRRILAETRISDPSRSDIEKVLLADECGWHCPYTGRNISMDALLANPQFDIEHIIPLSRSLDDSFANKTLCYHEENRAHKRNRTPFEAYSAAPHWTEIINRVKGFNGPLAKVKLLRFLMTETEFEEVYKDFAERQLNDTRYASRLAAEYLGCLYGGVIDADGKRRVQVSPGGVTAFLRGEWRLNEILGLRGEKNRQDHRHHAVDALVIALADARAVQQLSLAAQNATAEGRRRFAKMPPPWPGFLEEARAHVERIVVSRRVDHRVRGALHNETIYGKSRSGPDATTGAEKTRHHLRRPVTYMTTEARIEAIVDPAVRHAVLAKFHEHGGDAKKFEHDPPALRTRDGRSIPIRRVRTVESLTVDTVGRGARARHVKPGANHHLAIVASVDRRGNEKWTGHIVSLVEAHRRKSAGLPIVQRDWGDGRRLVMTLRTTEAVVIAEGHGESICFVSSVSEKQCELRRNTDARMVSEVQSAGKAGGRLALSLGLLQAANCRKVRITHLGEVLPCND